MGDLSYSWNYYLKNAKDADKIRLKRYAYVSLFGLKTLDELKYALYEATKPIERIGEDFAWDDLEPKSVLKTIAGPMRWVVSRISKIPGIQNYIGLTESILFYFVGKQLICIDDLERAGTGLDVLDIFGLVSFLKEQRGCRIVLLLNSEEIAAQQKTVFDKQFEKVVDTHLYFDPTPVEAASIVFPTPEGSKKDLLEHCIKLGIKNIRVIKKIEKICARFEEIIGTEYLGLIYQTIHSATVFAWSKYQKDGAPPPFDFLKDISRLHGISRDKEKISEDDKRWQVLMAEYKFGNVDDYDLAVHSVVDSGVFDRDMLLKAAEKQSHGIAKSKQEQVIHDTWGLYHGSFEDNEKEVMDKIFSVSFDNVKIISPSNLDATVQTLKEFDRTEDAKKLIQQYIKERPGEKELYDLRNNPFGDIRDSDIREAFEEKLLEFVDKRNSADVMEAMVKNRGWNPEDEELLDKLSAEDFYKLFKNTQGDRLHIIIRAALMMRSNDSEEARMRNSIFRKATEALEKIAAETRLNKKRVASHGVRLGETKE